MLLIQGGDVLTREGLQRVDIRVDGDTITDVSQQDSATEGCVVLDATSKTIVPGLINAHTHAHNNLGRGSCDTMTLEQLRATGAWRLSDRSAEDQYISAALGAVEMLMTGCTATFDLFTALPAMSPESVDAVASAYLDVGIRAVLAPQAADGTVFDAISGFKESLPANLQRAIPAPHASSGELLRLLEYAIRTWDAKSERIRVAVAPVVPDECTDSFLLGCRDLVEEYGVLLHTHLAETKVQAVSAWIRRGKTLVAHLDELGILGANFVGGHAVWVTDEDIARLANSGSSVVHNPVSNLRIGSGIAPVHEMVRAGVAVGVGTDGSMSSDNQNMYEAIKLAGLLSTIRRPYQPGDWISARSAWELGTLGSAAVLGMPDTIGAIEAGRKADLVMLNTDSSLFSPLNDIHNSLVYAQTGADVDTVLVGGRVVVQGGRLQTLDERALYRRAEEAAARSRQKLQRDSAMRRQLTRFVDTRCEEIAALPYAVDRFAAGTSVPHAQSEREDVSAHVER